MTHLRRRIIAGVFYFIGCIAMCYSVYFECNPAFILTLRMKIILAGIILLCTCIGSACIYNTLTLKQRHILNMVSVFILFSYYIFLSAQLLFFDEYMNRSVTVSVDLEAYFYRNSNLIPFDTIQFYWNALKYHTINQQSVISNLLGNFIVFMPLTFFLPYFAKSMRRLPFLWLFCALLICTVEVMQVVSQTGSCDIDDFILNFSGLLLISLIFRIPPLNKFLHKHHFHLSTIKR